MADPITPPGFVAFEAGEARGVCVPHVADAMREMLRAGTLYDYARQDPGVRTLTGRLAVYALMLPGGAERAVIQRNHHGGLIGGLRSALFLPPTRAPRELRTSERPLAQGVPTPAMLGYAVYHAAGVFRRADIMTREVPDAVDLSAPLNSA